MIMSVEIDSKAWRNVRLPFYRNFYDTFDGISFLFILTREFRELKNSDYNETLYICRKRE